MSARSSCEGVEAFVLGELIPLVAEVLNGLLAKPIRGGPILLRMAWGNRISVLFPFGLVSNLRGGDQATAFEDVTPRSVRPLSCARI